MPATSVPAVSFWNRLAWLPLPLAAGAIIALWLMNLTNSHESRSLMLMMNLVSVGFVALCVGYLTARSFLLNGQLGLLMLGSGVLLWGLTTVAASALLGRGANITVTIHNLGVFGAALCHLGGLMWQAKLRQPGRWLPTAFAGVLLVAGLIVWAAIAGWLPIFFVQGQGGTPLREAVLGLAIVIYAATAFLMLVKNRWQPSEVLWWYGLGLALLAVGLAGVAIQTVHGSLLGWTARLTQSFGGVYLLVATITAARETGSWNVLLTAVEEAWSEHKAATGRRSRRPLHYVLRYGLAIVAVAAAFGMRMALTEWVGPGLPTYITFYPAIMVVAVFVGLGPGVMATVLAGCGVVCWVLPPTGEFAIATLADRVGLLIFTGSGFFISKAVQMYQRNQHQAAEALRRSEAQFRSLAESVPQVVWATRPDGWNIYFNQRWVEYTGMTLEESSGHGWNIPFHPDDKQRSRDAWKNATQNNAEYSLEVRLRRADGVYRWWLVRGEPLRDADGKIIKWFGTCTDIHDLKLAAETLRQANTYNRGLIEASLDPLVTIGPEGKITDVNAATEAATGRVRTELIGTDFSDYFTDPEKARDGYEQVFCEGAVRDYPLELRHREGSVISVFYNATVYRNELGQVVGVFAAARDITEQKRAAAALHRLNRELRAISDCNQVMVRAVDEQTLLNDICRIVCDEAGYRMAWVGYAENDEAKTVRPVAWAGVEDGYITNARITWDDTERGRGPTGTVIRRGETVCIQDFANDARVAPWRENALQRGYRSNIALPLKDENAKTFGALTIYSSEFNAFTPDEVRLMEELSGDLAFGITILRERKERKYAEQSIALMSVALNNVRESAFLIGPDARFQYVNDEACRSLGYSRAELLGMGVPEIDPDFPIERWSEIWNALKTQRSLTFETRHRTKDGRIIPVEIVAIRFEHDGREYNMAMARDVTERMQAQEKIAHLAAIVESSADAIIGKALDETILSWNRGAEQIYGYTAEEAVGRSISIIVPPSLETELAAIMERLKHGERIEHLETARQRKDGQIIQVALTISPIKDARGQIVGASTIARDITERKRVEDALVFVAQRGWQISGENFFAALAQFLGEKLDMDYALIDKIDENPEMAETVALYARGAITPNMRYALKGTPCENVMGRKLCVYPQGIQQLFPEDTLLPGMGAESYIGIPLWDSTGHPIGLIAVMGTKPLPDDAPVTQLLQLVATRAAAELERRRAEEALRVSEARYKSIIAVSNTGAWEYHRDTDYLWCSPEYFSMLGYNIADFEMSGKANLKETWIDLLHPEDRDRAANHFAEYLKNGSVGMYESYLRLSRKNGSWAWIWCRGQTLRTKDGDLTNLTVGTHIDITERVKAEEVLRLQSGALQAAANAIVITDRDGKIEWVNPAFTKSSGYAADEVMGRIPAILKSGSHSRDFYEEMWRTILAGKVWHGEMINKRKDGKLYTDDTTITPVRGAGGQVAHFVAIKQDVTERRALEEHFRQAQKMEAIGTLAGGIAHDFNNILAAMFGYGNLLQQDAEGNAAAQEDVGEILKAAGRAKELVQQILAFSRQREQKRQIIQPNTVVKEVVKFLRPSLPTNIKIKINLDDAPNILADPTQIYQVIVNLATNALHAMEGRPGQLTLSLASFQPDAEFIQSHPGFPPIQFARLTVADTGHGMDAKTKERIFEPFFTTKPVGQGTGLGLAVVHGIVQSHEGIIRVESQPGQGTAFHLYFPAQTSRDTLTNADTGEIAVGHGQHILLLDDEPSLTLPLQRLLVRLNYQVTVSNRAQEAVEMFRQNPARFDLVITDLTMPEMDGLEVAGQLRRLRPDVPVILTTGLAPELNHEKLLAAGICEILEKPVRLATLAAVLNRRLAK